MSGADLTKRGTGPAAQMIFWFTGWLTVPIMCIMIYLYLWPLVSSTFFRRIRLVQAVALQVANVTHESHFWLQSVITLQDRSRTRQNRHQSVSIGQCSEATQLEETSKAGEQNATESHNTQPTDSSSPTSGQFLTLETSDAGMPEIRAQLGASTTGPNVDSIAEELAISTGASAQENIIQSDDSLTSEETAEEQNNRSRKGKGKMLEE